MTYRQQMALFIRIFLTQILVILISIFILAIVFIILKNCGIKVDNKTNYSNLYNNFGKYTLLIVGFIAPIVEECIFRLPLSFKKRDLFFSLVVILFLVVYNFYSKNIIFLLILIFLMFFIFYFTMRHTQEYFDKIKTLYGNYILYSSILVFTILHITNIEYFELKLLPIYILLQIPVLFLGIFFTYTRMKLGLIYSILLHSLVNTIVLLLKS